MITPDNMHEHLRSLQRCKPIYMTYPFGLLHSSCLMFLLNSILVNFGDDCPVFDGLFEYCQVYTSGSIGKFDQIWGKKP